MADDITTSAPDVDPDTKIEQLKPNVAAFDTLTIYFIAAALLLGLLLFLAIRKAIKLGWLDYFYDLPKTEEPEAKQVWQFGAINAARLQEQHGARILKRAGVGEDINKQIEFDQLIAMPKPRPLPVVKRTGGIYIKNTNRFHITNRHIARRVENAVFLTSGLGPSKRIDSRSLMGNASSLEDVRIETPGTNLPSLETLLSIAQASGSRDSGLGDSVPHSTRSSEIRPYSPEEGGIKSLRELMHGTSSPSSSLDRADLNKQSAVPQTGDTDGEIEQDTGERKPSSIAAASPKKSSGQGVRETKKKTKSASKVANGSSPADAGPSSGASSPRSDFRQPPVQPGKAAGQMYSRWGTLDTMPSSSSYLRRAPPAGPSRHYFDSVVLSPHRIHDSMDMPANPPISSQPVPREEDEEDEQGNEDDKEESVSGRSGSAVHFSNEVSRYDYPYEDDTLPRGLSGQSSEDHGNIAVKEHAGGGGGGGDSDLNQVTSMDELPDYNEVLDTDIGYQELGLDEEGEQVVFVTKV